MGHDQRTAHAAIGRRPDHIGADREVDRLRKFLPPIPGRRWVLEKAASALAALCSVALDRADSQSLDSGVVSTIECRGGLSRTKTMSGGLVVVAVLGLIPEANRILMTTAQSKSGADILTG